MGEWLTIDNALSAVLILIMFAIGATLRFSDFKKVLYQPKSICLGLVLQMMFLPLFTFCVVSLVDIDPLYKVGFIIVSLCPGGTTSNFISYLVGADVALSIALTTINSFLILLTIPLGTNLALTYFIHESTPFQLPFLSTMSSVFMIILLPAIAGLLFNNYFASLSGMIRKPLKVLTVCLLAFVYGVKLFGNKEHGGTGIELTEILLLLPVAIFIQLTAMILSYFLAVKWLSRKLSCLTIGIEVGLQNTALALLIASVFLMNVEMSKPALVYAMFSFFTTLAFAMAVFQWVIRKERKKYAK